MPDSDPTYDLIIVGGGPSGAASALYAKRHGLSTLLLDRAKFPRDKICGDALSGKSIGLLNDLQLLDKVRDLPGAPINKVVFGSPDHVEAVIDLTRHKLKDVVTGDWVPMEGFVIRRKLLDNMLFEEAGNAAGTTVEGFRVTDLLWEGDRVCGVRGRLDGEEVERTYRGRIVLGCDGFKSIVSRKTGLYDHDPKHWVVALRCHYEGVTGLEERIELHFVDEVIPGYFWAFPLENGYANVGIGMLHASVKRRNVDLRRTLQQVISRPPFAERFRDARATEKPVGWNQRPLLRQAGRPSRRRGRGGRRLLGILPQTLRRPSLGCPRRRVPHQQAAAGPRTMASVAESHHPQGGQEPGGQ